jgi:hypothetical protein
VRYIAAGLLVAVLILLIVAMFWWGMTPVRKARRERKPREDPKPAKRGLYGHPVGVIQALHAKLPKLDGYVWETVVRGDALGEIKIHLTLISALTMTPVATTSASLTYRLRDERWDAWYEEEPNSLKRRKEFYDRIIWPMSKWASQEISTRTDVYEYRID